MIKKFGILAKLIIIWFLNYYSGSPIEKYIIQMRDKDTRNWVDAATVPGGKTNGKVTAVQEGREYEFRVIAVNKAGPGQSSILVD